MRLFFCFCVGLIFGLTIKSEQAYSSHKLISPATQDQIFKEMERAYRARDGFKEKGNNLTRLKAHL